ncbi:MAG: hypothetical protein Q8R30_01075 [bacterium]|nr:hypothetical protein [bacterium]MDZ4285687.1 hypothetical protein [Candidatus Sungbacteria bacterium]
MVEVKRRERETTGAMLRRFTRRVQMSGALLNARKKRFHTAKPTKRITRDSALRRIGIKKERAKLEKLGKLKEEVRGRRSSG